MPSLPLLLLQIAVILGACRLLTPVFARLGQPAVMAEMTAGLLLGPSCFGWLAPDLSAFVFPDGSLSTLALISQVGLVLFMFLVGWRLDVGHLKSIGRVALVTSLVSIIVPFSLGSWVAAVAWYRYAPPGVDAVPFVLFMGTAMSITAFPGTGANSDGSPTAHHNHRHAGGGVCGVRRCRRLVDPRGHHGHRSRWQPRRCWPPAARSFGLRHGDGRHRPADAYEVRSPQGMERPPIWR